MTKEVNFPAIPASTIKKIDKDKINIFWKKAMLKPIAPVSTIHLFSKIVPDVRMLSCKNRFRVHT